MAKKKKQQRAGPNPVPSQNSIDSINDTIVTQPKPQEKIAISTSGSANIQGSNASVISSATSGSSVSSFASQQPATSSSDQESPKYESYRPPPGLQERVNPFDKNKPPSYELPKTVTTTSSIYSSSNPSSSYSSPSKTSSYTPKPVEYTPYTPPVVSSTTSSSAISSGFDYSYSPSPIPIYKSEKSVEKVEEPPKPAATSTDSVSIRGKLERKLSDADIVFGSKPTEPYMSTYSSSSYSRNRSNSSFASTSTDAEYNTSSRGDLFRRENPFQKSLSVSSDKDGDFASDSRVRAYQGITNDAFKDSFDSPRDTSYTSSKPSWSNNEEEFDLK